MKIGMILDAIYPSDARVTNECEELIKNGHEVYLFCLPYQKDYIKSEIINDIKVRRYYCPLLTYKLSALANDFSLYSILMKSKIKDFVLNNKIDRMHIHDIQITKAAVDVCNKYNLKYTLDLHENRHEIMKSYKHVNSFLGKLLISVKRWKKAEEKYISKAEKVIVVTHQAKKEIIERCKILNDNVIVYPNTVRKSFYQNKKYDEELKKKYAKNYVLLYIGNTSERRGLDTVLDSMISIAKEVPEIKLIIIGKSSYDRKIKFKINKLKISNLVDFIGWQKEEDLYKYLLISDIGLSPLYRNLHHDTTYANKIFQYISFNIPLLCSDSTAQAELINKFKCGRIFKEKNVEDFISNLLLMINNKEIYIKLQNNCYDAIAKLNNSVVSRDLIKIYE
jgi:glycosyltransferase involved in cell wall biosynthesis